MDNYAKLLLSGGLIIFNNILGHFFPPFSIFLTPLVAGTTTYLLSYSSIKFPIRIFLLISAIIFNDMLIKIFAGGIHDSEGAGWINLFFVLGAAVSTILAIVITLRNDLSLLKCLFCLTIPVLLLCYINYFAFFGMTYEEPRSKSAKISVDKGLFVGELAFSKKNVVFQDDSLTLLNGWVERQQHVDHTGIIKRINQNRGFNFIIHVKSNKQPYDSNLMYVSNNEQHNGKNSIGPIIEFSLQELSSFLRFYSYHQTDKDSVIEEIKLTTK